jgi:hypothetical protein
VNAADRAAGVRARIARAFARKNPTRAFLDEAEDIVLEAIIAHERAIRRECSDREPAFHSHSNSE